MKRIRQLIGGRRGFSLLEVVIAMAIFMLGMAGIAILLISSVRGNKFSSDLWTANGLAASELERLMTLPSNDPGLQDGAGTTGGTGGLDDGSNRPGSGAAPDFTVRTAVNGRYTVFYNVASGTPAVNCRTFRIFVQWNDKGTTREISLDGVRVS